MSLGSIDFGVIVDGAIVVTEAILVRREATPDLPLDEQDIKHTAANVTQPIFFATLIIMTAYLPLLGLGTCRGQTVFADCLHDRLRIVRNAAL